MSRNFVASLKERQPDAKGRPAWFIEIEFHEKIPGLSGDTIAIELNSGTEEEQASAVVQSLNKHGVRLHIA